MLGLGLFWTFTVVHKRERLNVRQRRKKRTESQEKAPNSHWWERFYCSAGWRTGWAPEPRWPCGLLGFGFSLWSWCRWRRPWTAGRSFGRCRLCSPGRGSGPRSGHWCGPPFQSSDLTDREKAGNITDVWFYNLHMLKKGCAWGCSLQVSLSRLRFRTSTVICFHMTLLLQQMFYCRPKNIF